MHAAAFMLLFVQNFNIRRKSHTLQLRASLALPERVFMVFLSVCYLCGVLLPS